MKEIFLGILQGLTEFLPISSSGHLALIGNHFGFVNVGFFVFLHLGTLLAVFVYMLPKIFDIIFLKKDWEYLKFVLIGILPASIVGFFFHGFIEKTFSSVKFVGLFFLFNGFYLLTSIFYKNKYNSLDFKRSLIIGFSQIFALFPGISRSGVTINTALLLGLDPKESFDFSFMMSIPLILGANVLEIFKGKIEFSPFYLLGFLFSFISGIFALFLLEKFVKKGKLYYFGLYTLGIGVGIFLKYVI